VKGIQLIKIKDQIPFKGEIITKMKTRVGSLENLLKTHWARKAQFFLLQYYHCPQGLGGATI
jgi:hypothetical protein